MFENVIADDPLPIHMSCAAACATALSSISGVKVALETGGDQLEHCNHWAVRFNPTSDIMYL
jgi:hypothetical protein